MKGNTYPKWYGKSMYFFSCSSTRQVKYNPRFLVFWRSTLCVLFKKIFDESYMLDVVLDTFTRLILVECHPHGGNLCACI
uniref:Uncharacterized protein n=1 Tax=Arundo donax TaxID=35708 RepID=A0A0A9UDM8_ARUDO